MVIERRITTTSYACSFCQETYSRKEDAEKCEFYCAKLLKSPDITSLGLSSRTYNILKIAGIDTVAEVIGMPDSNLLKLKGFGQVSLRELHQQLQSFVDQDEGTDKFRESSIRTNAKRKVRRQAFSREVPLFESTAWINRPLELPEQQRRQIAQFVDSQDWVGLYKGYLWHNDTWENGFPDILRLETQLRSSMQNGEIKKKDVLDVAYWGKYYYPLKITSPESIPIGEKIPKGDGSAILQALITFKENVGGFGPTYLSKLLRFAFPSQAGALDSRIVRVFGLGDPTVNQYQWLTIRTHKLGSEWTINRDRLWPLEYEKWLRILSTMVGLINEKEVFCPHPHKFLDAGLRNKGIWINADAEMAILTYVTGVLNRFEGKNPGMF